MVSALRRDSDNTGGGKSCPRDPPDDRRIMRIHSFWRRAVLAIASSALLLTAAGPLAAQPFGRATRSTDSVRRLPTAAQLAQSGSHTEVTFQWDAAVGTPGTAAQRGALAELHQFQMRDSRPVFDPPVRERNPQIGPDDIVVVALDAQGNEVSWQRIKDPRILRAEMPDAAGRLSGQTLYRTDTELTVTVPDDVMAVALDVYEPVETGGTLSLRALARVALR